MRTISLVLTVAAFASTGAAHSSPAAAALTVAQTPAESLDTGADEAGVVSPAPAAPAPATPAAAPAPASDPTADSLAAAAARVADTAKPVLAPEPVAVVAPLLSSLRVGGTFQLKGFYDGFTADRDDQKRLSFDLRRARVDLAAELGGRFSFEGQFLLEGDGRRLGSEAVYLAYDHSAFFGIRGGKMKRPFSQEAMQSSKALYTVERGELYQDFLNRVNGYSGYDLGLIVQGGFVDDDVPVRYEAGVFNGRQSGNADSAYQNQHAEDVDKGFKAKDFAFRLVAQPFEVLKVEFSASTKAAEDRGDGEDFEYHVNTAYELGADLAWSGLRLLGEVAWGDNHRGTDQRIVSGASRFFAFYGTAVWREEYRRGRASEMVLKVEGLDPDFEPGSGESTPNDGRLRYTGGINWFFTPRVSVLVDYSVLQPVTEVPDEGDLVHDLDAMWRFSF